MHVYPADALNERLCPIVDEGGTLNVKAGTVVRNMRGSSQVFVWSFSRAGKTNTVNVEDVTVTNCQTYSSSNSETGGAAVFSPCTVRAAAAF